MIGGREMPARHVPAHFFCFYSSFAFEVNNFVTLSIKWLF